MAAILNKKFLHWDFWGLCIGVLSGRPGNFTESFSFLHFFQVGLILELLLLDYKTIKMMCIDGKEVSLSPLEAYNNIIKQVNQT